MHCVVRTQEIHTDAFMEVLTARRGMSLRRDDSVYFRKPRFGVRTCPLVETTVRRLALWSRWSATGCCTRADTAWLASVQAVLGRGCLRCEQRFSRLFGGGGCYVDGREVFARVVRYRSHTRSCDHTWTQVMGVEIKSASWTQINGGPGHKSMGMFLCRGDTDVV